MTFLHVSIVWSGPAKPPQQLAGILNLAIDWIALGPTLYVIYTADSTYDWQSRFQAVVSTTDSFLITEIKDPVWAGGWMPKAFWEWLQKLRPPQLGGLPAAQILPPAKY
jgi:hypothetical protein